MNYTHTHTHVCANVLFTLSPSESRAYPVDSRYTSGRGKGEEKETRARARKQNSSHTPSREVCERIIINSSDSSDPAESCYLLSYARVCSYKTSLYRLYLLHHSTPWRVCASLAVKPLAGLYESVYAKFPARQRFKFITRIYCSCHTSANLD